MPTNTEGVVFAISPSMDTLSTYLDTVSGSFMFRGVPADIYRVEIDPSTTSGLSKKEVSNVKVVNGQETDLGTIDLTAQ